jgi:peroxiredoxin
MERPPVFRTSRWLACTVGSLLALAWVGGCSPASDSADGVGDAAAARKREEAPGFTLPLLDGDSVTLAELRGKTVIIDFWATWCPPCEFQVPELNAFWAEHSADGDIAVFGISVDDGGPDVVRPWVEEKGVSYPILLGDDGLARRYGAMGFPTLIIIAPDGTIDSRHVGLIERASLEEAIARQREAASATAVHSVHPVRPDEVVLARAGERRGR